MWPSGDPVRCNASHLTDVRVVQAQDFGNRGQAKIQTGVFQEEQRAGDCLQPVSLQKPRCAGNDGGCSGSLLPHL